MSESTGCGPCFSPSPLIWVRHHRTPKLDSATSPGNGSAPWVETHYVMFTVSVAPSLTPITGISEEWDVPLRKHLGRR
ncbi:unnamed protein product [Merluccius merluccius]